MEETATQTADWGKGCLIIYCKWCHDIERIFFIWNWSYKDLSTGTYFSVCTNSPKYKQIPVFYDIPLKICILACNLWKFSWTKSQIQKKPYWTIKLKQCVESQPETATHTNIFTKKIKKKSIKSSKPSLWKLGLVIKFYWWVYCFHILLGRSGYSTKTGQGGSHQTVTGRWQFLKKNHKHGSIQFPSATVPDWYCLCTTACWEGYWRRNKFEAVQCTTAIKKNVHKNIV